LPNGLEPEGNGYRVSMVYATSKQRLARLTAPATLGLSAPASPTALYEPVNGAWRPARYTEVEGESGFTSLVELVRPGTFLQAYDPTTAQPSATVTPVPSGPPAASSRSTLSVAVFVGGTGLLLVTILLTLRFRRTRSDAARDDARAE